MGDQTARAAAPVRLIDEGAVTCSRRSEPRRINPQIPVLRDPVAQLAAERQAQSGLIAARPAVRQRPEASAASATDTATRE